MTTEAFIKLLEQRQLVSAGVIRQLRAKAEQGDERITPKSILKYLVKRDLIARKAAEELLQTTILVSEKTESSILGLAPLADFEPPRAAPTPRQPAKEPSPSPPLEIAPLGQDGGGDDLFSAIESSGVGGDPFADEVVTLEPLNQVAEPAVAVAGSKLRAPQRAKSKPRKKPKVTKSRGKNEWDSPLILFGGGGLAVLALASVVLWWLVFRESADSLLAQANEAFDRGQYSRAEDLYEAFVEKHTGHPQWSHAKVRRAMTPLWEKSESRNYSVAAQMAPEAISEIEDEPAFIADADNPGQLPAAKEELSSLLTNIAAGLAEQAESATTDDEVKQRIADLQTVLALTANSKYVPAELRRANKLDEVRELLERVEAREQREAELSAALAAMDEAIAGGKPASALEVRAKLLVNYPTLSDDGSLAAKVKEASAAEMATIKFVEGRQAATTSPAPSPVAAELALADRRGQAVDAEGVVFIKVDGGVYGLNASDGSLLWRRFVGLDGDALPLQLPNGNLVAVDSRNKELLCLNAETANLVWRLPLEGQLASPVVAGERLLVASDAGRLYVVEQTSGELIGYVAFSQPLRLPPVVSDGGERIYLLGKHSNLYTLSGDNFSCIGVQYLGHAPGGIVVPPALILNKVLIADNSGRETSQIRAFSINAERAPEQEVGGQRLSGLVLTPIQRLGRRAAVVTSRGQAAVFDISGQNDDSAITLLAAREAQNDEQLAHFALLQEGHLWIAGSQLSKLVVQPTGNQLAVRSIERDYRNDVFDYPLQTVGNLIFHLRRPQNRPGVLVSAIDAEGRSIWETEIAAPPAGAPAVDASGLTITAASASGAIYLLDREAMARRVKDQAERLNAPPETVPILTASAALAEGRLALGGIGAKQVLHYRPGNPRQSVSMIELAGPLSCDPIAWRDGFVTSTDVGQVTFHSGDDGMPAATSFQPELKPGQEFHWLRPAVVGKGADAQLVISDGVEKLYIVDLKSQPRPHLAAVTSANVGGSPLETPLAIVGNQVFAGNEAGKLARFTLPELRANEPVDIGGRVVWGPHAVGAGVLLATEAGELLLVNDGGTVAWRQPLKRGTFTGSPLVDGGVAFVLAAEGGIARISLSDGSEQAYADLGQSAVAGPVAFGPRLVASAADGTLLVVNRP